MDVDNREDDGDEDDEDVEDDEDDDDDKVVMEKVFWRSSFVEVLCKLLLTQSIAQCRISTSFPPLLDAIQRQKYPRAGLTNNQTALCTIRVLSILDMIHTLIDLSETI